MSLDIREHDGGIRMRVRAQPRAARDEIVGEHGDALKVRLAAAPVEGAANAALEKLLARALGVPKTAVSVVAGRASRDKIVQIAGIGPARARAALERSG